jgi:hypothetical protein
MATISYYLGGSIRFLCPGTFLRRYTIAIPRTGLEGNHTSGLRRKETLKPDVNQT